MKKNSEKFSEIEKDIKQKHKIKDAQEAMEKAKQYKLQKESKKKLKKGNYLREQYSLMKIKDVRKYLFETYATLIFSKLDLDEFIKAELEQKAIIVIDELDKIVRSSDSASTSSKASDEGVQFDLLPLLDGTSISVNQKTRIETRNMLFVGGGAFEKVKPTDLAVELQGRLPIRTKMQDLTKEDFIAILQDTKYNLLLQNI